MHSKMRLLVMMKKMKIKIEIEIDTEVQQDLNTIEEIVEKLQDLLYYQSKEED